MDYDEVRSIVGDWGRASAYKGAPDITVHLFDLLGAVEDLREALQGAVKGPDTQDAREELCIVEVERHVMHALHHYRWMRYELGLEPEEWVDGFPPPDINGDGSPKVAPPPP